MAVAVVAVAVVAVVAVRWRQCSRNSSVAVLAQAPSFFQVFCLRGSMQIDAAPGVDEEEEESTLHLAPRLSGGGGDGAWNRNMRPRHDGFAGNQQPQHPPAGFLPPPVREVPVPNGEVVSYLRIEFRPALSWAACNGRWSWTCGTCEAHWKCFPVLPGHPEGIVEVSLHQGGQVGQGYRNFTCDICMVAWRAVQA